MQFSFIDWEIDLQFKVGTSHSMAYYILIKDFLLKNKGEAKEIDREEFFEAYEEVKGLLNFTKHVDWGSSNRGISIINSK